MDTIALVDLYPDENERVVAHEVKRAGGGPAAVASVVLSRLGVRTAIVGTIGDDADGAQVMAIFAHEGVDTRGISIGVSATSGSVIIASKARNARAISTRQPMRQERINSAAQELMRKAQWVHADHVGMPQISGLVRGNGPLISFDAGYGVERFNCASVDLFAPTDHQMALRHPGLTLAAAVEKEAVSAQNMVAATQGSDGSIGYSSKTGLVNASGFEVDVVSTLGAGDVFHGALIAQLLQGHDLQDGLRRANAAAALSCRALDAQSMIPTTAQLNEFLKAYK